MASPLHSTLPPQQRWHPLPTAVSGAASQACAGETQQATCAAKTSSSRVLIDKIWHPLKVAGGARALFQRTALAYIITQLANLQATDGIMWRALRQCHAFSDPPWHRVCPETSAEHQQSWRRTLPAFVNVPYPLEELGLFIAVWEIDDSVDHTGSGVCTKQKHAENRQLRTFIF